MITQRQQMNVLLVVTTAELSAGAVGHTLNLKANRQANKMIRTFASGTCAARPNQT